MEELLFEEQKLFFVGWLGLVQKKLKYLVQILVEGLGGEGFVDFIFENHCQDFYGDSGWIVFEQFVAIMIDKILKNLS